MTQGPEAGSRVHGNTEIVFTIKPIEVEVPSVVGHSKREAGRLLRQVGLYEFLDTNTPSAPDLGSWIVGRQDPKAGTIIIAGQPVRLTLEMLRVIVLDVAQMQVSDIPYGTTVTLTVGTRVPDLVGQSVQSTYEMLKNSGLEFQIDGTQANGEPITSQNPIAGEIVPLGTKLMLATRPFDVRFEITGNGSSALVTWITPGTFSISQDTQAALPWTQIFPGSFSKYERGNFSAQMNNGTSITCNLYINGKLVDTNTSTGRYAIVSCG